ncbi:MAG: LysR family transcriptional regulator [Lachnospiraceae bacterium]|nr:LysR family transcriptional regulator [Lachnospiraceae bacterium]
MTLNQLQYFAVVAKYENYHKAADKLFISQPSLSRSMASLEAELGVALFEKNGRNISLTKAGKLFLEYAERIVRECDAAVRKMQEISRGGGQIDIGYTYPLAKQYIPHQVRSFLNKEENKHVTFNFFQGHTPAIINRLKLGELDIGFGGYMSGNDDLEFFPIYSRELVIISPKTHPLNKQDKVSIHELDNYPVIGYDRSAWMGRYLVKLSKKLDLHPNVVIDCPDEHSIQAMVSENFGIAIVPWIGEIDQDKVTVHRLSDVKLNNKTYMIWMKNRFQMPAAERFIQYISRKSPTIED